MLLQNAKIWYNENGAWVEIQELISLDVMYIKSENEREEDNRSGAYTNEGIKSIEINFKRGYNSFLDSFKPQTSGDIMIKFLNGAISIQGSYGVPKGGKINTKHKDGTTTTYMRFKPNFEKTFIVAARGGEGGHVDDVEVNGVSVVSGGVAEVNLLPYAKKTELDKKLSLSGGTMDTYAQISMHSGRIVDLAEPTGPTHAATKKYVDEHSASLSHYLKTLNVSGNTMTFKKVVDGVTEDQSYTPNFDDKFIALTGDQTITGIKNFATNLQLAGHTVATEDNLLAEQTTRANADTALQTNIDAKMNKVNGVGTGTTSLENVTVSGDTTCDDLAVNGDATFTGSVTIPDAVNATEAVSKQQLDKKVDRVVTEDNGAKSIIDNQKGQHGAVMQSNFDNTLVSISTNDEDGEDGILAQIYAKKKDTNIGTRINVTQDKIYYTRNKSSSAVTADDEIATKGDITGGTVAIDEKSIVKDGDGKLSVSYGGKYIETLKVIMNGMVVGTSIDANIYEITSAGAVEQEGFAIGDSIRGTISLAGTPVNFNGAAEELTVTKEMSGEAFNFIGIKVADAIPAMGVDTVYFGEYDDTAAGLRKYVLAVASGDASAYINLVDLNAKVGSVEIETINPKVLPIDNDTITLNEYNQLKASVDETTINSKIAKTATIEAVWSGTKAEYEALGIHDPKTLYNITDDSSSISVYTKDESDAKFATKVDLQSGLATRETVGACYTKAESDALLLNKLDSSKSTFQTTAPTAAITDGGIHIVHLTSDVGVTEYDGYIYMYDED